MTHKPWMVRLVVRAGLAKGVLAGGLLAAGVLSPSSVPVLAQAPAAPASLPPGTVAEDENGYKIQVPYIDPKKKASEVGQLRINEGKARTFAWQVLGGALPLNDNKAAFDFYYNKILLPSFTQTHESSLSSLPDERQKLFRDHLEKSAPNQDVHRYLVDLIYDAMVPVVQDNYHPAVRYNAMLIISGLNDTDSVRVGAVKLTPEPMVRALPFIYEQFKKPENSDAIRVAALLGLVRHLEWDNFRGPVESPTPAINPATRAAILKDLLALARQKDPPEGRSVEGHEWFRRRAIDGLTQASYYRVDAEIAAALDAILKDDSESIAMRCAAATAVGKIAYQAPVKLDPTPTAKELGYLALLACHKELTRVTEMNKQEYERITRLQGGGSSGGYGGYGGGMGMEGGYGGGGMGGASPTRLAPGGTGPEEGAGVYAGPRPGGSVRPKAPGTSGGMMEGGMPSSGGMMGGMMGGYGGYGSSGAQKVADPKQYRFDYVRRRIRGQLYAIEVGLVGPDGFQKYLAAQKAATTPALPMNAAAPAPAGTPVATVPRGVFDQAKDKAEKDYVKQVIDGVVKLAKAVEDTNTEFVDLDKELRKQMPALERITKKIAAAAPVAPVSDLPEAPSIPVVPVTPKAGPAGAATPPAATPPAATPPAATRPVAPPATPPVAAPTPMPAAVSAP